MTEEPLLTIRGWLSRGWASYKRDPVPLIGGTLVLTAFAVATSSIDAVFDTSAGLIASLVVGPAFYAGWCFLCLKHIRGEETWVTDVLTGFARFGTVFLTWVSLFFIVLFGLFLFIIPGIYWSCKFGLSLFPVMEKGVPPQDALRISGRITEGHVGKIFCMALLIVVLSFLSVPFYVGLGGRGFESDPELVAAGFLPYILNLLVISPWLGVSIAAAYDDLIKAAGKEESA